MTDSPLPKRLKEARVAAGISQKRLGIAAGIDEFSASPRINQYETGKHTPDFSTLKRIARVLSVPTAYFYAEEDELANKIKLFL
ncbi:MAG: helix-turn-helix transcriptional regulator [Legionella sp.]|uniref:helix-turn-helix domain-containing protein n=1 Tax=Legionella sp. TaxID=459 RepID=UPI002849D636|nr:helix-turn-helix transcriptional regulator [Legionella sp.]